MSSSKLPFGRRCALISACFLLASINALAADVFAPPTTTAASSTDQDARISRLESSLAAALDRLEKTGSDSNRKEKGIQLEDPLPLNLPPSPLKASASRASNAAGAVTDTMPEQERVLGLMNGFEIYVLDGIVRKRPIETPMTGQTLPALARGSSQ